MQIYRSDQTFSVIIFLVNIYSGKLCVFKVFEYMKILNQRDKTVRIAFDLVVYFRLQQHHKSKRCI